MTNRSVILAIPIIISLHAIVACQCACPATSERVIPPAEVAHTFFEAIQNSEPDVFSEEFMTTYFTGDFLNEFQADREYIENLDFDDAALIFREPVMLDEDNAIVRTDIWSAVNTYQTSYVVFLKREYTWKVDAFRRLFHLLVSCTRIGSN